MVKQKNNTNRHAKSTLDKHSYKKFYYKKFVFFFLSICSNKQIDFFIQGELYLDLGIVLGNFNKYVFGWFQTFSVPIQPQWIGVHAAASSKTQTRYVIRKLKIFENFYTFFIAWYKLAVFKSLIFFTNNFGLKNWKFCLS